jgi:hypothetical protein
MHITLKAIALGVGLSGALLASPMITVEKPDFDAGTIREGAQKEVSHVFIVKNTGDSTLRITDARPG